MIDWKDRIERRLHTQNDQGSHTEADTNTFHPSALSRCKRQCAISKLGLEDHDTNTLWNFYLGTRQHEDIQSWFEGTLEGVEFEKELSHEEPFSHDGIQSILKFTGHCDVYDGYENVIYDFKTRKSWQGFDGASDSHKDQLTTYMKMAGVEQGQLVYVIKSAPWDDSKDIIKTWPEEGFFAFDEDRWQTILDRAKDINTGLYEFVEEYDRLPESRDELPFEKCGCWICSSEGDE